MLIAITGASGSGKSTLVNDVLYKALWKRLVDTRTLPGEHDGLDGPSLMQDLPLTGSSLREIHSPATRQHCDEGCHQQDSAIRGS